ncbi:hypothetical protein [Amycolatopsis sp. cmx-11-12]
MARIARELLARCRELTVQINALERELRDRVRELAPPDSTGLIYP